MRVTRTVNNTGEIELPSSPLPCPQALPPLCVKLYSLSSPGKYEHWYSINWQIFEKKSLSECLWLLNFVLFVHLLKKYFSRTNHIHLSKGTNFHQLNFPKWNLSLVGELFFFTCFNYLWQLTISDPEFELQSII